MKWTPCNTAPRDDPPRVDPYLTWAEATHWRGFRRLEGQRLGDGADEEIPRLRLLIQADTPQRAAELVDQVEWQVADIYRERVKAWGLRHFVASMPRSSEKIEWLKSLRPEDWRWELAIPFRDSETAARAQPVGAFGPTRQASDFRPVRHSAVKAGRWPMAPSRPLQVSAVIDFGCPFMNQAFLDPSGQSRVAALWDQGAEAPPRGWPKDRPWPWTCTRERMGYGRVLTGDVMNQLIREARDSAQPIDEAEAYRRIDYLIDYDDPRRRVWAATHGSHVASVAAGHPDPLALDGSEPDHAGSSPLIFVQLPALTAADSAGGSLGAQVLDALHFICDACPVGPANGHDDHRAVVTLSYGSLAGPHDGSSLIEQAMDELIRACEGRLSVLLAAGNGREAACHNRREVRVDRSALLRVSIAPEDFTDTFVETWFDSTALNDLHHVRARARTGEGDWSPWIAPEQSLMLKPIDRERRPVARLSFQTEVPNGARPLLLLAVAPTARPGDDDGPLAPVGSWQIEIKLDETARGKALRVGFDAYVERDDPGWLGVGVQSCFEEQRLGDEDNTLSSLATGQHTIVVGGVRMDDAAPVPYSATGRRADQAPPLVYAVCEESIDIPHVRGAGVRSADFLRLNGTSVAAPVLARRLFNAGAAGRGLDLEQVLDEVVSTEHQEATTQGRPPLLYRSR